MEAVVQDPRASLLNDSAEVGIGRSPRSSKGDVPVNVQLIDPKALMATIADAQASNEPYARWLLGRFWQGARLRLAEEGRYLRALLELRRLDDRDLDDLALGRADLPGLARSYARSAS
jgi:uncharacterized protein YjiS (DUF1127 family)